MSERKIRRIVNVAETEGTRISDLPDGVISHILSRTPIKYAIRTSVLSKYWKDKWKSVDTININDMEFLIRKRRVNRGFVDFVERMISSENITSFSLSLWRVYGSIVPFWIECTSRLKVETLKLFYAHDGGVLDFTDFNKGSLKRLELVLRGYLQMPSMTVPHLTYLYLDGLKVINSSGNEKLELEFPNLKKLKIRACLWPDKKMVEIHAPALTAFKHESSDEATEIKIIGANLVKFKSSGGFQENCILTGCTVVDAYLLKYHKPDDEQFYIMFGSKVRQLMKGFNGMKYFTISGCLSQGLALSIEPPLAVYDKLVRLVLHSPGYSGALLELLNAAPSLKSLAIDRVSGDLYRDDFGAVEPIPSCLLFKLEEIKLNYFSWTNQFHVEKFLLENGGQLERVYVSVHDFMPKKDIMERLSTFSTCSTTTSFTIVVT